MKTWYLYKHKNFVEILKEQDHFLFSEKNYGKMF